MIQMQAIYLNAEWTIFNLQAGEKYDTNLFMDVTKSKRKPPRTSMIDFLSSHFIFLPLVLMLVVQKFVSYV